MNSRVKRTSDIFLYSFAFLLILFAIAGVYMDYERVEAIASIASVVGVLFTTADLLACVKESNEKFLSLVDKMSEKIIELRSLERVRVRRLLKYCKFKYDMELKKPKTTQEFRESVLFTYKKALEIIAPIDEAMDCILKDKELKELTEKVETDKRKNKLKKLGILSDTLIAIGAISAFVLLYLYETISIPSIFPNILTIISFSVVLLIYARHGQEDQAMEAVEEFVRDTITESEEKMKNERIRIKQIETAMCENPKSLQQDAEIRLLIFLMHILDGDDEGDIVLEK